MDFIDEVIEKDLLPKEGKYSNNPHDSGGETMWGITLATARRNGYTGPMRLMPKQVAVEIYKKEFWVKPDFDKIAALSKRVAMEVFDTGVNCGPKRASEFLQRALNSLNRQGKDYADITVDGDVGPATLRALQAFLRLRKLEGEVVLLKILNVLQGAFYIELAERRAKDEEFIFGWFRTRIEIPLGKL